MRVDIDVIMPTRARAGRADLLRRAIASVLGQRGAHAVPLLVVNGGAADPRLVDELQQDRRVRVLRMPGEGLPEALRAGLAAVSAPFFATLDDDDELLPDALVNRLRAIEAVPGTDVVVTNGLRRGPAGDAVHVQDPPAIERDPLAALVTVNWLLPGSWLCRTTAVPDRLFEDMPRFLECTWLALRFASDARMRFLAQPTVVWHQHTPQSVSASREFRIGQADALERLLQRNMPAALRATFETRLRQACHDNADLFLEENELGEAWRWHLRSLRQRAGWRHLLYTRRLLFAALARPAHARPAD